MRHLSLLLPLLFLLVTPSFAADEAKSYLCISDMGTGFSFDQQLGWRKSGFTADDKYIVARSSSDPGKWEVKRTGETTADAVCEEGFDKYGGLNCTGFFEFRMNKVNSRFLIAYLYGYWTDNVPATARTFQEGKNTPMLQIGKCSPL